MRVRTHVIEALTAEVRLKPDSTHTTLTPKVRLMPDTTYETEEPPTPEVQLQPDTTYTGVVSGFSRTRNEA
jgi:hypothetical protein